VSERSLCSISGACRRDRSANSAPMMSNDTSSDAMFDHVTVASPIKLPVLSAGSRTALQSDAGFSTSTVAPSDVDVGNSSAVIIIVLSALVLAAIFFTVCGLLVKSQALVTPRTNLPIRSHLLAACPRGGATH